MPLLAATTDASTIVEAATTRNTQSAKLRTAPIRSSAPLPPGSAAPTEAEGQIKSLEDQLQQITQRIGDLRGELRGTEQQRSDVQQQIGEARTEANKGRAFSNVA